MPKPAALCSLRHAIQKERIIMKEKTAAAYARYSTDNQTENSIEYQMHEITGYCLKHHIKLTHQFVDEGCSGTNTNRASFQQMIEAARRREEMLSNSKH